MDPIGIGTEAANAGGFVLFLAHLVLDGVGLWKQWWVPGLFWQERGDRVKKVDEANEALRTANTLLLTELATVKAENASYRERLGERRRGGDRG